MLPGGILASRKIATALTTHRFTGDDCSQIDCWSRNTTPELMHRSHEREQPSRSWPLVPASQHLLEALCRSFPTNAA